MWNSTRTVVVGVGCAMAFAGPPVAQAATLNQAKPIKTTQRITTLFSSSQAAINVGTSDGKLAGVTVHGALRAVAVFMSATSFTARGALFYAAGALKYTLHGTATPTPDGTLKVSGSGKLTGGSGKYGHAHGSFTFSGTKPANSFETWTLTGKVSYR